VSTDPRAAERPPVGLVRQWLGLAYGRAAAWHRAWYVNHPTDRRRLVRPVVSVGNLTIGGSGKTPVVAHLARWLLAQGERPAILSRGYARRVRVDGVTVVSDTTGVRESVERSGDEPQMLARSLPGVPVMVCADRYLAGTLAERQFGCTVHLLDDGFQHHALARDVDLLLVSPEDLDDWVVPAGRLREPAAAAAVATAFLVPGPSGSAPNESVQARLPAGAEMPLFTTVLLPGPPRRVEPFGLPFPVASDAQVMALAGIARPERFFETVREGGWSVVREESVRDHHWFSAAEVTRLVARAVEAGADAVLTTEKDAIRLSGVPAAAAAVAASAVPFGYLPVTVSVEPAEQFGAWLLDRLHAARAARPVRAGRGQTTHETIPAG
jgi:tetraacyldisaccharide 4'-kinase